MKHKHQRNLALIAGMSLLLTVAGCSAAEDPNSSGDVETSSDYPDFAQHLADPKVLVAADSGSVKPLKFTEEGSGEMQGVVVDLTKEAAARLGLEARFEKVSGDSVIPGVLANRFDVALGLGDFAERRETIDFVDTIKGGVVLLTAKGNPEGVQGRSDLCGRTLAIVKGSIQQGYADEEQTKCSADGKAPIDIQGYADGPSAVLALESGRASVEWSDLAVANQLISDSPEKFELAGDPEFLAPYGTGIPVGKPELRDALHQAFTEMFEDGTYMKILKDWGQESLALDSIEINGSEF